MEGTRGKRWNLEGRKEKGRQERGGECRKGK